MGFLSCDSQTCLAQGQPVLGAGLGENQVKNIAGRLVLKSPILSAPVLVWVSDPVALVFLWASTVLHALMLPTGSRGRRGAQGCGAASPKQSSVSCSTYENKQKEGKSYPITHSHGSGAVPPRVCWFARPPAA